MSINLLNIIQRVQNKHSLLEFVYTAHDKWPLPFHASLPVDVVPTTSSPPPALRVSILDSSFNPPTRAHLALVLSKPPPPADNEVEEAPKDEVRCSETDYDARLLLFSVRNADKLPKPSDASHAQRIEMTMLMAQNELATARRSVANVAIALIEEPIFVNKASIVRFTLLERLSSLRSSASLASRLPSDVELTFLLGFDTLERVVSPRYYASTEAMHSALRTFLSPASESGDNCRIVCSRRVGSEGPSTAMTLEKQVMDRVEGLSATAAARVLLCDTITRREQSFSSTSIRSSRGAGQEEWREMVPQSVADYLVKEKLYLQ